ncbi:MAG: hypothetical protein ABJN04_04075 [Hyphomicrobiales bacterium]
MVRFLSSFVLIVALVMGGLAYFAIDMEPYAGTATRRGGFKEHTYGWLAPQVYQASHLYEEIDDPKEADNADVLVVGDSFSNSPNSWPDYLVEKTGLDTKVIHFSKVKLNTLHEELAALENPPKLTILISQEWLAARRLSTLAHCDAEPHKYSLSQAKPILMKRPIKGNRQKHYRRTAESFGEKFDIALSFVKKRILHTTVLDNEIKKFHLDVDHAFSSRKSNVFLAQPRAVASYNETNLQQLTQGVQCFAKRGQEFGMKTAVAIFPSPHQAYWDHVIEADRKAYPLHKTLSENLPDLSPALTIDLLTPLKEAVDDGVQDLYLADDHHTGTAGYKVVTDAIVSSLLREKYIKEDPNIVYGLRLGFRINSEN